MKKVLNFLNEIFETLDRARYASELARNGKWSTARKMMLEEKP